MLYPPDQSDEHIHMQDPPHLSRFKSDFWGGTGRYSPSRNFGERENRTRFSNARALRLFQLKYLF